MIYIFAGHGGADVGAVGVDRRTEARETLKLRNAICAALKAKGVKYRIDDDNDALHDVLAKATTGSGSVVLDIHFNAAVKSSATGVEVIVADNADSITVEFACDIGASVVDNAKLKWRGVKRERDTPRGRLGVMREHGIVALLETCFISNQKDMQSYDAAVGGIAARVADTLIKYDALRR